MKQNAITRTFTPDELAAMSIEDLGIIEASLAMTVGHITEANQARIYPRPIAKRMISDLEMLSSHIDERIKQDMRRELGLLDIKEKSEMSREDRLDATRKRQKELREKLGMTVAETGPETPESV